MKLVTRGAIHFFAAVFLFFIVGMALSLLLIQSQFIDMRFDSEFVITVMIFTGVWFFFARVFMNAHTLAIWEKKWISLLLVIVSLAFILIITWLEGSLSILPAYMARKAVFMVNTMTLSNMNTFLIVGLVIGVLLLITAHRKPLSLSKETKMEWSRLSKGNRIGMMSLFAFLAVFLLVYMGQGGIHAAINHSVVYLKNADVEGFATTYYHLDRWLL